MNLCCYVSTEFMPRFRIQDLLTGSSKSYNGKYSLRVIGGSGKSVDDIEYFSEDEIFRYNNKNALVTLHALWHLMARLIQF